MKNSDRFSADVRAETQLFLKAIDGEMDIPVSDVEPAPVSVPAVSVVCEVAVVERSEPVPAVSVVSAVLSPVAVVERSEPVPVSVRAERIISEVERSAEESARYQHRRVVVAPLAMLLALGLLFGAAGWSC